MKLAPMNVFVLLMLIASALTTIFVMTYLFLWLIGWAHTGELNK